VDKDGGGSHDDEGFTTARPKVKQTEDPAAVTTNPLESQFSSEALGVLMRLQQIGGLMTSPGAALAGVSNADVVTGIYANIDEEDDLASMKAEYVSVRPEILAEDGVDATGLEFLSPSRNGPIAGEDASVEENADAADSAANQSDAHYLLDLLSPVEGEGTAG
jgi:hypothetical protein